MKRVSLVCRDVLNVVFRDNSQPRKEVEETLSLTDSPLKRYVDLRSVFRIPSIVWKFGGRIKVSNIERCVVASARYNDLPRFSIVTRDTWHGYPKNTKSGITITRDTQSYSSTAFLKIFLLQLKSQNRSVVMLEDGPPFPRSIRSWSEKF